MKICHCQTQICAGGIKKKKKEEKKKNQKKKKSDKSIRHRVPTDGMPNKTVNYQLEFDATNDMREPDGINFNRYHCKKYISVCPKFPT